MQPVSPQQVHPPIEIYKLVCAAIKMIDFLYKFTFRNHKFKFTCVVFVPRKVNNYEYIIKILGESYKANKYNKRFLNCTYFEAVKVELTCTSEVHDEKVHARLSAFAVEQQSGDNCRVSQHDQHKQNP